MKQKIFTLMILLALVVAGGRAFGQTKWLPYLNSTYTDYTVSGLTANNGMAYNITVNNSATDPDAANAGGTINSGASGNIASGSTGNISITWTSTGTHNLWIKITTGGGCVNYRFRPITVSNNFNVEIVSLGADPTTGAYTDWDTQSEYTDDCPVFATNASFDATSSPSNGNSYVFFRVEKLADDGAITSWAFSVSTTSGGTIRYWDGSAWQSSSPSGLADGTVERLVRIEIANTTAASQVVDATVSATETMGALTASDGNATDNDASLTLSAFPDMSGVSFN